MLFIKKIMLLIAAAIIVIASIIGICTFLQMPITENSYLLIKEKAAVDTGLATHLDPEIQLLKKQLIENQANIKSLNLTILNKDKQAEQLKLETRLFIENALNESSNQKKWLELFIMKQQLRFTTWQQVQKNILIKIVKKGLLDDLKDELNDFNIGEFFLTQQEIETIQSLEIKIFNSEDFTIAD